MENFDMDAVVYQPQVHRFLEHIASVTDSALPKVATLTRPELSSDSITATGPTNSLV